MKDNVFFYTGSGKAGNLVGQVRGGLQIFRAYQRNVRNPRTDAQVMQRAKLAVYSQYSKIFAAAINVGYKGMSNTLISPRNAWVKDNYALGVVSGATPASLAIDPEAVRVSKGGLLNVQFGIPTGEIQDGHINIPVSSATLIPGYLENGDRVRVCVYNPDFDLAVINDDRVTVENAIGSGVNIMIPAAWEGLRVHVYGFITRPNVSGSLASSTSVYIGSVNLQ